MTSKQNDDQLEDLLTNPKYEQMDEIHLEIIADYLQADQATKDEVMAILRGWEVLH